MCCFFRCFPLNNFISFAFTLLKQIVLKSSKTHMCSYKPLFSNILAIYLALYLILKITVLHNDKHFENFF